MEHLIDIEELTRRTGINDSNKLLQLIDYAKSIHTENNKYNLTGHKTLAEIIENLAIGSLEPLNHLNVPRGTLFADIGTGSGIPGIPLAIKYNDSNGILFDSNQKKIRFINKTSSALKIENVRGVDIRVEDAGRTTEYRGKFDIVFTRAMSDIYTIAELSAPLLKIGGFLFLYINKGQIEFNKYILEHLSDLGFSNEFTLPANQQDESMKDVGLFLKKVEETDQKYPRRMPLIKRMSTEFL